MRSEMRLHSIWFFLLMTCVRISAEIDIHFLCVLYEGPLNSFIAVMHTTYIYLHNFADLYPCAVVMMNTHFLI